MSAPASLVSWAACRARVRRISPGAPCITAAQQPVSQPPPARRKPAFFCYYFDSNKARQTVRWGRFWDLKFALEKERKRAHPGRVCFAPAARLWAASSTSAARKPGFMSRLQGKGARHFVRRTLHHGGPTARFAAAARPSQANVFRYHFDSNEVRQTVRWGRFWSLEFAPEKRAKTCASGARLLCALRSPSGFGRHPA